MRSRSSLMVATWAADKSAGRNRLPTSSYSATGDTASTPTTRWAEATPILDGASRSGRRGHRWVHGHVSGSRVDGDGGAVDEREGTGGADDRGDVEFACQHGSVGKRPALSGDDAAREWEHDVVGGSRERHHKYLAGLERGDGSLGV